MEEYINTLMEMYGISESDRTKAENCINGACEYVKNYCHIKEIPNDLKHTIILMSADLYRNDISVQSGQFDSVTSIKVGDATVSYGNDTSSLTSVFKDYKSRLNKFRRLVWE